MRLADAPYSNSSVRPKGFEPFLGIDIVLRCKDIKKERLLCRSFSKKNILIINWIPGITDRIRTFSFPVFMRLPDDVTVETKGFEGRKDSSASLETFILL